MRKEKKERKREREREKERKKEREMKVYPSRMSRQEGHLEIHPANASEVNTFSKLPELPG